MKIYRYDSVKLNDCGEFPVESIKSLHFTKDILFVGDWRAEILGSTLFPANRGYVYTLKKLSETEKRKLRKMANGEEL